MPPNTPTILNKLPIRWVNGYGGQGQPPRTFVEVTYKEIHPKNAVDSRSGKLIVYSPMQDDKSDEPNGLDSLLPWRRHHAARKKLAAALLKARNQRDREREKRIKLTQRVAELECWVPRLARKGGPAYCLDGLSTSHTPGFLDDPDFAAAYRKGTETAGEDYLWHWRVHVALWIARQAATLEGDFVDLGAGRGFLAAAIQHVLDWPIDQRTYWMFDTFNGLVAEQISPEEFTVGRRAGPEGRYPECFAEVATQFSGQQQVRLVRGQIPGSLDVLENSTIAFCSFDMNCALPEIEAASRLWPQLAPGAWVLLDDYAYDGYEPQRQAWNEFAAQHDVHILNLPTGQGVIRGQTQNVNIFSMFRSHGSPKA